MDIVSNRSPLDTIGLVNISTQTGVQLSNVIGGLFNMVRIDLDENFEHTITSSDPKIIIIEIFNAGLEQFSFCREVAHRCENVDIPILVILDSKEASQMASGFYMGISDYIVRPIIPAEVLVRVSGQLQLAASHRALKNMGFDKDSILTPPDGVKSKLLLVDDSVESVRLMGEILREKYDVTIANNGQSALEEVERSQFDLIVLDICMPGMSGYDVCEVLKENSETSDIPIIFLTGRSEDDSELRGFSLGAVDYILKPVNSHVLEARISQQLSAAKKVKRLINLSYRDSLTKLPNRRYFDETLLNEFKRAKRNGSYLSLLMIDVDQFKKYNDHYGHEMGDQCLQKISSALNMASLRPGDLICRFGGEEFVALLPNTGRDGASFFAERLMDEVSKLSIAHSPNATHKYVTLSIGIATSKAGELDRLDKLIIEADKLLYQAKDQGRNRICSKPEEAIA